MLSIIYSEIVGFLFDSDWKQCRREEAQGEVRKTRGVSKHVASKDVSECLLAKQRSQVL